MVIVDQTDRYPKLGVIAEEIYVIYLIRFGLMREESVAITTGLGGTLVYLECVLLLAPALLVKLAKQGNLWRLWIGCRLEPIHSWES